MMRNNTGFTLIELLMVVAIIGILVSVTVSAYQTYTVRAQVSEGIAYTSSAKGWVVEAWSRNAAPPIDRLETGMAPQLAHAGGSYVNELAIVNGRIDITFGNDAHAEIAAETLSLTPYFSADSSIVWRCGNAPAPAGAAELAGGGISAEHRAPTMDSRYLPDDCR